MSRTFDVVVVGSGYGGAVVAARLAAQGRTVCVLERGTTFPPGAFPRTPDGIADAVWLPEDKQPRLGLYDVRRFGPVDVVQASGLGGGSLLGSGVLARPRTLDSGRWPIALEDLDEHFQRAEAALRGTPFPDTELARPRSMREAAERLGAEVQGPPLAIAFGGEGQAPGAPIVNGRANLHRRLRYTCRLVGECNLGCNYGAKESLDYTCLSAALAAGAVLRVGCDVSKLRPLPEGGYEVHFENRLANAPTSVPFASTTSKVRGRRVVLAAGAIGTTSLLLHSRRHLPGLSKQVGQAFSTNGEQLAVATGCVLGDDSHGPATTSVVSFAGDDPISVSEIGFPDFLAWISPLLRDAESGELPAHLPVLRRAYAAVTANAPVPPPGGWPAGMLGLFVLGGPAQRGELQRHGDRVEIAWAASSTAEREQADRALERARQVASALGGALVSGGGGTRELCLHPLGGCVMGESAAEGVVDGCGRVFGCSGLYVADASIVPGPLRVAPALTIAALGDRVATGILADAAVPAPAA